MRLSDAWKATAPEPLQPAIAHIRKTFHDILRAVTQSKDDCHKALIVPTRTLPEPKIFQGYFNGLRETVCNLVCNTFNLVLKVASKNVAQEPIEWARSQVEFMLDDELLGSEATKIRHWIAFACDGPVNREPPDLDTPAFEAWLFLQDWQSPAWLHMKPLGNTAYYPETAWVRDSVERSQRILGFHSGNFDLAVRKTLGDAAGYAHIQRAVSHGLVPSTVSVRETDGVSASLHSESTDKGSSSSVPSYEFWRDRTTGTWTIRITSLSPDAVPIADHTSVTLDYLWAALKAGRGGASLNQIACEAGIRRRPDADVVLCGGAQTAHARLPSEMSGQRVLDGRVLKQAKAKMKQLAAEAQKAEQDGHPDKAIALREEADNIQHHIQTQTRPFRGFRREKTDTARNADTVQKGIKRAFGAISKGNQQVGRFLRANLKFAEGRCSTQCDTSEWRFYE